MQSSDPIHISSYATGGRDHWSPSRHTKLGSYRLWNYSYKVINTAALHGVGFVLRAMKNFAPPPTPLQTLRSRHPQMCQRPGSGSDRWPCPSP